MNSEKNEKIFKDRVKFISFFLKMGLEGFKKKNLWISVRNIACWPKA